MNLRKIAFGDRDIQKKHHIHVNSTVSYWRDEFDGDGNQVVLAYGKQKKERNRGVCKREDMVSIGYRVNALRGEIGHG